MHPVGFNRGRVHHHRGVYTVEQTRVEQVELAATAFFGWAPENGDADAEIVGQSGEGQPGPDRRRCDDVVPAGMADSGQGVVLRADTEVQRTRTGRGREGGLSSGDAHSDREERVRRERIGGHSR